MEERAMAGRMVEFPSNGDGASGYLSTPAAGPGPGLVVIQEWWGLIPQIRRTADRFADAGFSALATDLYHGRAIGLQEPDEAAKALMALDMQRAARELSGSVDYLLSSGVARGGAVGCVGYCMGGGLAVALAASHSKVAACVDYYGAPTEDTDLSRVGAQVQGHFGTLDHFTPPEAVEQLAARLSAAGIGHTFYSYEGCDHAFANEDRPEVHQAAAAELTWQRTLDFLREALKA
jgi:carboxymethylenebutenolidase